MICKPITASPLRALNKDIGAALQTVLTTVRLHPRCRLMHRVQQHISMQIKVYISVSQSLAILCLWENHVYFYKLLNGKYNITPDKTTYNIADPSSMQDAT